MTAVVGSRKRIQGLDVIRGMAILLVILRHSWPNVFGTAGIVGVVVFFALSGYLITGLLLRDIQARGRVRYGRFYLHRAIRLLPALAFMLAGVAIMEGVLNLAGTRDQVPRGILVAATYTMNIPGFGHGTYLLNHLWTLANEEQFYLIWPVVLVIAVLWKRPALVVTACVVVVYFTMLATLLLSYPDVASIYTFPTSWTIAMIIGAAAQIWRSHIETILRGRAAAALAVAGGLGLLALAMIPEDKGAIWTYAAGGPVIAVLTVLMIFGLQSIPVVAAPVLPLVWLGVISYAAYLWNYPIGFWLGALDAGPARPLIQAVFTIVLGAVSWFLVETPFNRWRDRLDARGRDRAVRPGVQAGEHPSDPSTRAPTG